jgi:hypothetical protein
MASYRREAKILIVRRAEGEDEKWRERAPLSSTNFFQLTQLTQKSIKPEEQHFFQVAVNCRK